MAKQLDAPHCKYCGSANVRCDANAAWDEESGQWELAATYDSGTCEDCGQDQKSFDWHPPTTPQPASQT